MALSVKELIEKNKNAHKQHFYIESVYLSYNLIGKVLRHLLSEEKLLSAKSKTKLSDYIKTIKLHHSTNPVFNKKLKKSALKTITEFNTEFKIVNKELKYQYPEIKLKEASQKGINALVLLHTTVVKLKSNKNN